MSFEQYWTILVKRWKVIITCFIVVGLGTFVGSKLMTPLYQSTAIVQVAIQSANTSANYDSLLASDQLVQTEAKLATSDPVLREVASHYPGLSVGKLSGEVTSTSQIDTQLFEIDVLDADAVRSAKIANDVAVTLIKQQVQSTQQASLRSQRQIEQDLQYTQQQIINTHNQLGSLQAQKASQTQINALEVQLGNLQQHYSQVQAALAQLELTQAQNNNFLRLAQAAQPTSNPAKPSVLFNTGAGLLMGLLLGMLLAVLREQFDTRIRTPEALGQLLDWPVLATVWQLDSAKGEKVVNLTGHGANDESFRLLRANIGFAALHTPLHSLVVTSARCGAGKSTVAANLAIFMARAGKTTLLMDADLRHPSLHDLFALSTNNMGLSNAVRAFSTSELPETTSVASNISSVPSAGPGTSHASSAGSHPQPSPARAESAEALKNTAISLEPFVHSVGIPNLWVMPAGPLPANPAELLDSEAMQRLLTVISHYSVEVAIFDTPALLGLSDASILASKVDGTLVVVDITLTRKKDLKQAKALLMRAGACVLGCVVNKQRHRRNGTIYAEYYDVKEQRNQREQGANNAGSSPFTAGVSREPKMQFRTGVVKQGSIVNLCIENAAPPTNGLEHLEAKSDMGGENAENGRFPRASTTVHKDADQTIKLPPMPKRKYEQGERG